MKPLKNKIGTNNVTEANLLAEEFVTILTAQGKLDHADNAKFFRDADQSNKYLGVRMSNIFKLAKQFMPLPVTEIQKLLKSDYYEVRMGAVSIMDFRARNKNVSSHTKKELYDLYIKRHDRINNWDLVDRSAPYVVGGYLYDKARTPLYKLAKSQNVWERRTAIVSTYFFIRQNDIEDTFRIAEILVHDKHDLINKAVGSWVREAGKKDSIKLIDFLNKYATTMPRVTLRYAIENLDHKQKKIYMTQQNKQRC